MTAGSQAKGRKSPSFVACTGSGQTARRRLDPGRGVCPVCGQDRPIYDSNIHGRSLLDQHHDLALLKGR